MKEYSEVLRASDPDWKNQARKLFENGKDFVIVGVSDLTRNDCVALSQEFDYTTIFEDQGEEGEIILENFPLVQPKTLGFVPRKKIKNPPFR